MVPSLEILAGIFTQKNAPNNILEIAVTTQTPPHVSWEYKLDCVVHKFISLIYTTVFDMMLFLKIFRFVDSVC